MSEWVVSTNLARCRDCYSCVRACPVKAVRVQDGQAQVVPELCIACGSCVRACPQQAKSVREDLQAVKEALAAGQPLVASVAPSAPAFLCIQSFSQIEDALKELGFTEAGETAFGAEMVGLEHKDLVDRSPASHPWITSSCPVVINLIEKYYPDLIKHLAPVVSPMVAHGRWLRERHGEEAFIVFIGPCIGKKGEFQEEGLEEAIDAALTFEELRDWMREESVEIQPLASTGEERVPRANARLFPVEGGLVGTANMDTDILAGGIVTTSGLEACEDVLRSIRAGELEANLVELMACEGGCINGPAMDENDGVYLARQRVIDYASRRQPKPLPTRDEWPSLERSYRDKKIRLPEFSEEQIQEVLHMVDKYTPEDELNCGACGYPTCREKAVATLRGMAEATMCIPYMRRRAESLRQVVMDVTPNPVVIVDLQLNLQDMSPSAERALRVRRAEVAGQPLQKIMPVIDGFAKVRDTGMPLIGQTVRLRDDLIVEQTIVPVEGQSLLVGIMRDVTERVRQHEQLEHIRSETLHRTQEVVKNQMKVAHEIAQLLGETTAETKMMLSKLAKLLEESEG